MIVIKDQEYKSIKPEDLKPGDSIQVVHSEPVTHVYTQEQVAELMNLAHDAGYAYCRVDMRGDD